MPPEYSSGAASAGTMGYLLGVVLVGLGGALVALLRWFGNRILAQMEQRLARIEALEERFERHIAELPLHYQRRDDAIRELATINFKMDRFYELLLRSLNEQQGSKP